MSDLGKRQPNALKHGEVIAHYTTTKERERCLKAVEDEPKFLPAPGAEKYTYDWIFIRNIIEQIKQNIRERILKGDKK